VLPAYYDATVAALDNTPADNTITDRIATLGRVLFYDRRLSSNDSKSCASCHQQAAGFDDPARFSQGFAGGTFGTAHAMRLGNVRYYRPGTMFWNKRAANVEAQASAPITEARIQQALAQFERAMISTNSRWDSAYAQVFNTGLPNRGLNVTLPTLTAEEDRGRQLFFTAPNVGGAGCSACHVAPTFALAANSDSNGLDAGESIIFKSPSLKNVALSKAFMHDGRFATLAAVVEHYNSGIQAGPALDNRLRGPGGAPQRLNLSAADKAALVAFMTTLTDTVLVNDPKFANPFKK
jgi:cytochrome c peroxidase